MNSHIDTQQPTHKQWLSLTEYSQKYNVSISTLRRRIRAGSINVKLKEGKYFIVDERQSVPINQAQDTGVSGEKRLDSQGQGSFINKMLTSQQELYRLITQKEKKIEGLQNQISDFNTLVALLEKENSRLKNQLEQEKKIEEWLNK